MGLILSSLFKSETPHSPQTLPREIWSEIFRLLDMGSLRHGASLVCKEWNSIIKNDPRFSSKLSTIYPNPDPAELKLILGSFPVLKTLSIPFRESTMEENMMILKVNGLHLEKVIFRNFKNTSLDTCTMEPLKFIDFESFTFVPKDKDSLGIGNVQAMTIFLPDIPKNFDVERLGNTMKNNMERLCLELVPRKSKKKRLPENSYFDEHKSQVELVSKMIKNLLSLKHVKIMLHFYPHQVIIQELKKVCQPKISSFGFGLFIEASKIRTLIFNLGSLLAFAYFLDHFTTLHIMIVL